MSPEAKAFVTMIVIALAFGLVIGMYVGVGWVA